MSKEYKDYEERKAYAEDILKELSAEIENSPEPLKSSINYSLNGGGKRIRPVLFLEAVKLFNGEINSAVKKFMCAIECIHTYSLIHDDLPCMDNDDFRRGKPTNHKIFGEGIAVLAGDALLNLAFELLFDSIVLSSYNKNFIDAAAFLSKSTGKEGLIGGQTLDIYLKEDIMTPQKLDYIYRHKTGDLIIASMVCGAKIANAKGKDIELITTFADNFGYAFQIKDDILDYEEKIAHDIKNYIDFYGIVNAKKVLEEKINAAVDALSKLNGDIAFLKKFAVKSISRKV